MWSLCTHIASWATLSSRATCKGLKRTHRLEGCVLSTGRKCLGDPVFFLKNFYRMCLLPHTRSTCANGRMNLATSASRISPDGGVPRDSVFGHILLNTFVNDWNGSTGVGRERMKIENILSVNKHCKYFTYNIYRLFIYSPWHPWKTGFITFL